MDEYKYIIRQKIIKRNCLKIIIEESEFKYFLMIWKSRLCETYYIYKHSFYIVPLSCILNIPIIKYLNS